MKKAIEVVLAGTVIGATLAFGGVQPLAYSLAEVTLIGLLALLLFKQTRRGTINLHAPVWPLLFVFLLILQVVPLFGGLVLAISPTRGWPIYSAEFLGSGTGWATLSIAPHETVVASLKFLAYLSAFLLAAHLFDSRKGKAFLIQSLIFLGCFEAGYGIVQYVTGWQKIFTYTKQFDLEEATGTYINRNHFAGLLELVIPLVLGSAFYSFQRWVEQRRTGGRRASTAGGGFAAPRFVFYMFLSVLLMVALVFSRSRGGIISALFSCVFIAFLAQLRIRRKAWIVGVLVFLLSATGYGLWIGLNPVLARFEQLHEPNYLQLETRVVIWKDALGLIRDHPLLGTGLGTFGVAFRRYQTGLVGSYVDHAHNDYLQYCSETGLVGAALLFLPIFYLLGRMVISFLDDPRRYRRAVTLGCIGGTLALLIHSMMDFNLQIPANALVFAIVLGIGYKAACIERREEEQSSLRPPNQRTVEERSGFPLR